MIAPAFPTITAALAWWQGRDQAPLKAAMVPPCDALGDEVYDIGLAVVFRDLARLDSLISRLGRIDAAIQVNTPMVAYCRERGAEANARRIEAMILVLEVWKTELLSAAEDRRAVA